MNTNIRTKVVNDTNELIFKNKDLLVDNSADSDTTTVDDNVTVTIVQPKDTKYSIIVYIMEYRRSDEGDIFEADTDEGHKETFKAAKGSVYLVVLLDNTTNSTSTDYYRLNTSSRGKLTRDITIKFKDDSPATNPDATITIVQTDNQTIHVYTPQKSDGTDHTSTFTCPVGTTYEVEVIAASNYIAGTPNTTEGVFNSDMTINATPAAKATATITITQSDNQTIHVYTPQKSGGTDHTSTFTCPVGTTYEVEVIADKGYIAGIPNTTEGTFNSDMTINATPAVKAQIYIAKGSAPWYNTYDNNNDPQHGYWHDKSKVIKTDESVSGQATVTCKNVTNMYSMFNSCSNITSIDLSNFDTSKVDNMGFMLSGCSKLTSLDLSNFNTSNVKYMGGMFCNCSKLTTIDVSKFDTSKVTDMTQMFFGCSKLTSLDVSNFDTSKVTEMQQTFDTCSSLTSLDVTNFNTSNATDMKGMFSDCSKLTSLDVTNFDTSKVTDMFFMFKGCSNLISLDVSKFDTSKVEDMRGMFGDCSKLTTINVSKFNTSKVTNMDLMFSGCSNVTSLDVSKFDTSKVTNMGRMFNGCNNLTTLDLSSFDTSNVTDMDAMFSQCYKLNTLNVSNFNTSNVTDMNNMFSSCYNLTALDVSNFNTSKVTDMNDMFFHCNNLVSLNLSSFNTSKITNMSNMFLNCSNLVSLDVSKFDTSNVTTMWNMFGDCSSLASIDLSSFNTSNVKDMRWMFSSCGSLTTIKGVIDMKSCINYNSMFATCTKLKGVKIKNPPTDTDWWKNAGLSESQFTIVS